jgi:hypothetical protein
LNLHTDRATHGTGSLGKISMAVPSLFTSTTKGSSSDIPFRG